MDKIEPNLRKLSVTSSTSTQHSQASSVVINQNLLGLGKLNVDSVLLYISQVGNNDTLNTEGIYEERKRINRSNSPEVTPHSMKNLKSPLPPIAQSLPASSSQAQLLNFKGITQMEFSDSESPTTESHGYPESNGYYDEYDYSSDNGYDHDDEDEADFEDEDTYIDEGDESAAHGATENGYEDDDDFCAPPSPPRSPPREIDPDRLYGLYDFSGPDPLHCTLSRDEPVYLLNDEDNYWWLIQKLNKSERDGEISNDEDGKIGFVPAECLETYGERLARLNCFKNEELEKHEDIPEDDVQVLSGNKLKSVTFEYLGDVSVEKVVINVDSEDDEDVGSNQGSRQTFPNDIFSMPVGSLGLAPPIVEKQGSEVLSDIYPEVSLVVAKNGKKNALGAKEATNGVAETSTQTGGSKFRSSEDVESSPYSYKTITPNTTPVIPQLLQQTAVEFAQLAPPTMRPNDVDSIGSYSPDTPPGQQDSPTNSLRQEGIENGSGNQRIIRRSVILERLNQVTADIQEQFSMLDDLNYSDMEKIMFGRELLREDLSIYGSQGDQTSQKQSSEISLGGNSVRGESKENIREIPLDYDKKRQSSDLDDDVEVSNDTFTPSTSTASLVEKATKDKSIHDMFVPILGKFDELAERLDKLNDILG